MKVVLVRPSDLPKEEIFKKEVAGLYPSLGLLYLASSLENEGVDVRLCDELTTEDPAEIISSEKPDWVGITICTPMVKRARDIVQIAQNHHCRTMIGGPHVTALPKESLSETGADLAVAGEGEQVIVDILQNRTPSSIPGVTYIDHGVVKTNASRKWIKEIDSLAFPARHHIDWNQYQGTSEFGFPIRRGERWTNLISSRGCPFECTFCSGPLIFGKKIRTRSAQNIIEELTEVIDRWGVRNFTFSDDTFALNENHAQEFCRGVLKAGLDIKWSCYSRVGLSTETIALMKKAGCALIGLGVESGSKRILRKTKKNIQRDVVINTFENLKKAGIKTKAFFIVGLPGEEQEDFEESLKLAIKLRPTYLWLSIFLPLPGTESYHDSGTNNGGSFLSTNDPVIDKRHKQFLRRFYFHPTYLKTMLRLFSIHEWSYFFNMLKTYLIFSRSKH